MLEKELNTCNLAFGYGLSDGCCIFKVLRRFPNIEKLRSRASKDDPIELRSPVTKEELVAEVWIFIFLGCSL